MTSTLRGNHFRRLFELNLTMVVMSTSGVLGKYIELPPPVTIWCRCFIAAVLIGLFCWFAKFNLKPKNRADLITIGVSGLFLGGHWVTYFFALQYSNVAIGMLSLFTYPMVTALLEPLVFKSKLRPDHIIMGTVVVIAVYFLVPSFDFNNTYTQAVLFGLLSSVLYSLRNLIVKKQVIKYEGSVLMFYQLTTITIFLIPSLFVYDEINIAYQWEAVLTLAVVTTAIGHTLFVVSFRYFSVSTASIISTLQPVYGIILAILFLNEIPSTRSIIGGTLILMTVVFASMRSLKER